MCGRTGRHHQGKKRGGGICIFVKDSWCSQITIRETECDPDIELLCLSLRPFYLPREFGNVIICAAYVPPSGNAATAASRLADCVHNQLQRTPGAPVFILGDFNHCRLEQSLPGFHQYVKCGTRHSKVLDKCYGNIKEAYKAKTLPPLSNSDHATVHLRPTYKTALKSSKPLEKTVLQWTESSIETLKGCFLCTDWDIFLSHDLNEATDVITDYINFCVDNIIPKKHVLHFPNNKPYITQDIKACINKKKMAFKAKDRAEIAAAQKELNKMLRKARDKQKTFLEQGLTSSNSKELWNSMKKMTNLHTNKKQLITTNEEVRADELNNFFLRFSPQKELLDHELDWASLNNSSSSFSWKITSQQVQSTFQKVSNKKSTGPDGLPAMVLKTCAAELTAVWCPLFQRSLDCCTVPALWKKSIVIPIPKVQCPAENKDYRPIALTSVVMKCLEKIMVRMLKVEIASHLDPLQFAYRAGRSTEDAVISVTHLINKHLETPAAYARVLFADFSSAFDTIHPLFVDSETDQARS